MTVEVHPGVYPDCASLGRRLRGIDKLECRATAGLDPVEALRHSIKISSRWWVGMVDGQEEFALGVAPIENCDGWGAPWMLSTDKLFRGGHVKTFLSRTPEFMRKCSEGLDCLFNIVSEHNHASIRWLRYAGFSIRRDPAHVHTFKGIRFLEFIYLVPGGKYDIPYYQAKKDLEHV